MAWHLPFLSDGARASLRQELIPAITVTVVSVPQGVAYALIAGLPPAMGLYAGALPAIFGSLFRSSRHVITGPTNSLSLLIGTSTAAAVADPVAAAATLALLVGGMQILAGVLRLGALVDYISAAVVTGYITGAGVLIAVGQLPHLTRTDPLGGHLGERLVGWVGQLPETHALSALLGMGTVVAILVLRRFTSRGLGALGAVGAGVLLSVAFDLGHRGIVRVVDLAPVPMGLPPWTVPALTDLGALAPVALAGVVLSLVESTSVARSIASRTGQRLDIRQEFIGQGAANLAAAFFGAYPVSGSLSRSDLNERSGAKTRMSGVLAGLTMLMVLLGLGPVVDQIPIPSLAGLLLVIAVDLVDRERIAALLRTTSGDRLAFGGTLLGTWILPLDQAIYVGVGISIVLFLRRARLLVVRELRVDADLRLQEVDPDAVETPDLQRCQAIRVLHVEGPLFFGAASELDEALSRVVEDPSVQVVVVRLKRAQGLDYTAGEVLIAAHGRLEANGRVLLLVGMNASMMGTLERSGVAQTVGAAQLYPTRPGWFVAMNEALEHAVDLVGTDHDDGCPLRRYLAHREAHPRRVR